MTTRQKAPSPRNRLPSGELPGTGKGSEAKRRRMLAPLAVTEGVPTIVCCDMWPPGRLTQVKLDAYKRLIDEGLIRIRRVVYHRVTGITVVDYWSQLPHAWTLTRLRETAALLDPGQQIRLEGIT